MSDNLEDKWTDSRAKDAESATRSSIKEGPIGDTRLRWWNLRFRDAELERRYQLSYFDQNINGTRIGLISALLVLLVFAVFEPHLLQVPEVVNLVRLLFVMPVIVICLMVSFTLRAQFYRLLAAATVAVVLSQIAILVVVGADSATNTTMAYLQHLLFIAAVLFQPFRLLVLPIVGLTVLMSAALSQYGDGSGMVTNYEVAVQGVSVTCLLVLYLREQGQRQLFASALEVSLLRNETERQQSNQISWLRNLSRYLEHELRNHVFIVQSNLEFLQEDVASEQRPFVRRALRSVDKLGELCDSVGEASTLESALQLDQMHAVNFSRMVSERVLERARDLEEVNPLELEVDPDLWVNGSEVRLLQVFDHLLNNALDYSSEDAFVRIEVKSIARSVYFTVHNRGEPLPNDRDVFEVFDTSRPKTHLGMGLYVSRKIVEHHGGSIEARTQFGQTIVLVTLPQVDAPFLREAPRASHFDNVLKLDERVRQARAGTNNKAGGNQPNSDSSDNEGEV